MSTLQISLIVLAVLAVGGLGLHNWWQERKYRKQWASTFGRHAAEVGGQRDPVDEESWSEPALVQVVVNEAGLDSEPEPEPESESGPEPKPAIDPLYEVATSERPALSQSEMESHTIAVRQAALPTAPFDALLEYSIAMHTLDGMPSTAFTALIENQRSENRVVRWFGFVDSQDKWGDISPWRNQIFTDAVVNIQLADRQGALTEPVLQALIESVRLLAARFHGVIDYEELAPTLARAAKLDQFCMDVDVLIGLNVVSNDGQVFNGASIDQMARAAGMTLDATGVFQRRNERGDILYTLCNHEDVPFTSEQMDTLATHGVTLLFEVPRIDNGVVVFAEMARFGQQLAQSLGGRLVDDNIRPLSGAGVEKIQTQLVHLYQRMEAFEIPAGSRRALRLFN